MRKTYIYIIKNIINDKVYIGRTVNPSDRFYRHRIRAYKPTDKNYKYALCRAIRKYGTENFTFNVLIICGSNEAAYYESSLIKLYKSIDPKFGYNILDGTEKSISHDKIVRDKISSSLKKFYKTNIHWAKGTKFSPEAKKRASEIRLGKCSDKMRKHLLKNNAIYSKKLKISTMDGKIIGEYISVNDAARKLNIDESCLSKVCRGKRLQHKGYIGEYI